MNAIALYIPCPDRKTAEKLARLLLNKRLIACANIFPIHSMYWWKGRIENAKEHVIFAKSIKERYTSIINEVKSVHPYEIPLIARFDVETNKEYLTWLRKETSK